jgi:hypothetical protein
MAAQPVVIAAAMAAGLLDPGSLAGPPTWERSYAEDLAGAHADAMVRLQSAVGPDLPNLLLAEQVIRAEWFRMRILRDERDLELARIAAAAALCESRRLAKKRRRSIQRVALGDAEVRRRERVARARRRTSA